MKISKVKSQKNVSIDAVNGEVENKISKNGNLLTINLVITILKILYLLLSLKLMSIKLINIPIRKL